uniref:Uncharacterized protein n=1 Tax=Oryza nivara TaxID=4536 RepID=A0A0E0HRA7_ORYNI
MCQRSCGRGTSTTAAVALCVRAWRGWDGESKDVATVAPRRGLAGREWGERGRRRRRATSGPGGEGTRRARTPPPSRTRLHRFSFPNLVWGTHRLLHCSKNPASSPPPVASDTPSPDKKKVAHRSADGVGVGGSPQRGPQWPWNLRTRRSATVAPRPEGSDDAADAAPDRAPLLAMTKKWASCYPRRRSPRSSRQEEGKERGGCDDMVTLTCGVYVGPMLTQLPRRIKPGSKPLEDLK